MKVLFRMERVKRENITKAVKHDLRLTNVPHADPDEPIAVIYNLPEFNAHIDGQNYKVKLTDYSKLPEYLLGAFDYINLKRKEKGLNPFRKNTAPIVEFIIGFSKDSREFVNNPQNWKELDSKVLEYLTLLNKKYGVIPFIAVRHSDETTTHYHILAINYSKKTGKTLTKTFSRKDLSRLQDLLAETFKPLGFERGKKYTPQTPPEQRRHKKPAILRAELEQEIQQLELQRKKLLEELELIRKRKEEEEQRLKELQQQLQILNKELKEKQQILQRYRENFQKAQHTTERFRDFFKQNFNQLFSKYFKKPLFGKPKYELPPEALEKVLNLFFNRWKFAFDSYIYLAKFGALTKEDFDRKVEEETNKRIENLKKQLQKEHEQQLNSLKRKYEDEIKELKDLLNDYEEALKVLGIHSSYEAELLMNEYEELKEQNKQLSSENEELKKQLQKNENYYNKLFTEILNTLHAYGFDLARNKNGNLILTKYEPPHNSLKRKPR